MVTEYIIKKGNIYMALEQPQVKNEIARIIPHMKPGDELTIQRAGLTLVKGETKPEPKPKEEEAKIQGATVEEVPVVEEAVEEAAEPEPTPKPAAKPRKRRKTTT